MIKFDFLYLENNPQEARNLERKLQLMTKMLISELFD